MEDAREWLNINGLVLRNPEDEYSDEVPAGHVISQFPEAGSPVQAGDPVDLIISRGREQGSSVSYSIDLYPQVSHGQLIKVYLEDEEGTRVVFEGAFMGQAISTQGIGSGKLVLMELRDQEYHIVDIKRFP